MIFRKELQNLRESSGFLNILSSFAAKARPCVRQYGNAYK